MLKINKIKSIEQQIKKGETAWRQLLNNSQIMCKNQPQFLDPSANACQLRMTYSKLQSIKKTRYFQKVPYLENTKGSFLLQKQSKIKQARTLDVKKSNIFHFHLLNQQTRSSRDKTPDLVRTIDVSLIKKLTDQKKNNAELAKSQEGKKNQQFTDYFRKVILSQKANSDVSKFYSEGRGVSMTDRIKFQKLQRVKWSILNRKLQEKQKSFRCVSKKLSTYQMNQSSSWKLPGLSKSSKKVSNKKNINKQTQFQQKSSSNYGCQPWQFEPIFNEQQH